jgi:hypothetical protein
MQPHKKHVIVIQPDKNKAHFSFHPTTKNPKHTKTTNTAGKKGGKIFWSRPRRRGSAGRS